MEVKEYPGSIPISKWKEEERPRERLMLRGASYLSDSELLAIILRSGDTRSSAVDISRRILGRAGNSLKKLFRLSAAELMSISGIGMAKAAAIMAVAELSVRISSEPDEERPLVRSSSAAAGILIPVLGRLSHEECWILYLNREGRLICKEKISSGGISATVFDARIIIRKALEKVASSIILAHNHPSGNPRPGESDRRNTKTLRDAALLFDITLADHIIVAGDKYYSFADEQAIIFPS